MKWWLVVFILTSNGWESGEQFEGWWAIEEDSREACETHRDFANKTNETTPLASKICFACEQRSPDGATTFGNCTGPCEPCETNLDSSVSASND